MIKRRILVVFSLFFVCLTFLCSCQKSLKDYKLQDLMNDDNLYCFIYEGPNGRAIAHKNGYINDLEFTIICEEIVEIGNYRYVQKNGNLYYVVSRDKISYVRAYILLEVITKDDYIKGLIN